MKLNENQQKEIKRVIKEIVENHIDGQLNYEWEGSDFTERLLDELPEVVGIKEVIQKNESTITFDNELYQKFLNHTTDFIFESLEFS